MRHRIPGPSHPSRRAAVVRLAAAGAAWAAWLAPATPTAAQPRDNLMVSWRVVSAGRGSHSRAGLRRGEVVIDSRRGVVGGQGSVTWSSGHSSHDETAFQQVLVMNGGRARIDVRHEVPRTVWQWAVATPLRPSLVNPQAQAGLVAQTVWMDSGQGLSVRPQWAGGSAPVRLELEAEAPLRAAQGRHGWEGSEEDPPPRLSAQTTLSVPMGQWVAVARTRHQEAQGDDRGGTWQSGQGHEDQAVLEVRVTRP